MAKTTFFSLLQHRTRHNIEFSGKQLERRLHGHFIGGCVAGSMLVSSIYSFGMNWEKVGVDFWSVTGLVCGCFFCWMLWDSAREDLRQLTRFQLEEKSEVENAPPSQ